jgi:serine-type D-Ala-D-Ala endopeptidase (penicillin-binding protein 7)
MKVILAKLKSMPVSKIIRKVLISLLIVFLQLSGSALALAAKDAKPAKTSLKESRIKPKLGAAPIHPAKSARSNRKARAHSRSHQSIAKLRASPRRQAAHSPQKPHGQRSAKSIRENRGHRATNRRVKYALSILPPVFSAGELAGLNLTSDPLGLESNAAFILDASNARTLFEKHSDVALPIASITKLMTGLVVMEAGQNMDEMLEVTESDIDRERHTASKLSIGTKLSRADMLHIALMSSENRAASVLGHNYPGGLPAFVAAMNAKARAVGMSNTRFVDPTGLSSQNMASARDLAKLVIAAHKHPRIAQYTTHAGHAIDTGRRILTYANSNQLVGNADWDIEIQKTGYIREAGRCLVMQVKVDSRSIVMVFLDSKMSHARFSDANRMREWLRGEKAQPKAVLLKSADVQN